MRDVGRTREEFVNHSTARDLQSVLLFSQTSRVCYYPNKPGDRKCGLLLNYADARTDRSNSTPAGINSLTSCCKQMLLCTIHASQINTNLLAR